MDTNTDITITRTDLFVGYGVRRPFKWTYSCTGPDGRRFTNDSLVTLRQLLRRKYGRGVRIIEPWKES